MMYKTVTVSFRTKRKLMELLDRISRKSGCSRSSLIEAVLHSFLNGKSDSGINLENRMEIKGLEPSADESEQSRGITYVTVGGVRVGLPKNKRCRISFDEKQSLFHLDFVPGQETGPDLLPSSELGVDWAGYSFMETDTNRISVPSTEDRK